MTSPAHIDTVAEPADSDIATYGRVVSRCAIPAGAATRPSTSKPPTALVASAVVTATTSNRSTPSDRTGSPRAAATAASRLAKSSGRAITSTTTITAPQTSAVTVASPADRPKIEPNRNVMLAEPSA